MTDEALELEIAKIIDPEAWDEVSAEDNDEVAGIFADAWEEAQVRAKYILALVKREIDQ